MMPRRVQRLSGSSCKRGSRSPKVGSSELAALRTKLTRWPCRPSLGLLYIRHLCRIIGMRIAGRRVCSAERGTSGLGFDDGGRSVRPELDPSCCSSRHLQPHLLALPDSLTSAIIPAGRCRPLRLAGDDRRPRRDADRTGRRDHRNPKGRLTAARMVRTCSC